MSLSAEQIKKNWEIYRGLCNKLGERTENINKMLDHFEERMVVCPASSKYHCSFCGGLIDHSLRVCSNLLKLNKTFELNLPKESMILCSLWHDGGKIGNLNEDNYIPTEEDWKLRRGIKDRKSVV